MSTMEELRAKRKAAVMSCLCDGKNRSMSRYGLRAHTGIPDRQIRGIIEELRNEGWLICNDQDGEGYYLAETDTEILRQYRRECARAMSILRELKAFRQEARRIQQEEESADQMTIEEILMLMEGKI